MLLDILAKRVEKLIVENASVILTTIGVSGVMSTAALAARAAFKSAEVIKTEELARAVTVDGEEMTDHPDYVPMTSKDKAALVWKLYIPAAISAGMTIAAVIGVNHIGAKKAAAMASAYGLAEKALDEWKKKTKEVAGEEKTKEIRESIVRDRFDRSFPDPIIVGTGKFLCLDEHTSRFFRSTREDIREAVVSINEMIQHDGSASLTDFWRHIGLESTAESDEIGWDTDALLELEWGHGISKEGEPFLSYKFRTAPKAKHYLSSY